MSNYIKGPELQKFSNAIAQVEVGHDIHSVSWKVSDKGFATLKATRHTKSNTVSLVVTEASDKGTRKQVFITLSPNEACALASLIMADMPQEFPVAKTI